MKGHQRIIDMRARGIKPTVVWVNDMAGYRPDCEDRSISVSVHGDLPEGCDFRFLEGVATVVLESVSQARTERLTKALLQHVGRVISTLWQDENTARIVRVTGFEETQIG